MFVAQTQMEVGEMISSLSLLVSGLVVRAVSGAKGGGRRAIFRSSGIQSQNNQNYEKYSSHRSSDYDECEYRVLSKY